MVTRKDVAELAGVSVTIVSRVMNNKGYVAAEKREAVKKAAEQLGYRMSDNSTSVTNKSNRSLMFFSKDLGNLFNTELFRGILAGASARGFSVTLSGTPLSNMTMLQNMEVDGLIFANDDLAREYHAQWASKLHIPAVSACFGTQIKNPTGIPFVDVDYNHGMDLLIQHLRNLGHQKIALASPYQFYGEQPRHISYILTMQPVLGADLTKYAFCNHYIYQQSNEWINEEFYRNEGFRAAEEFYERRSDATAIICFNDDFAMGVIRRFHELGIRVPEDVSVAGFDGIDVGQFYIPRLTTINANPQNFGEELSRVLIDMIEGIRVRNRMELPMHLIEGESCAPPRKEKFFDAG